MRLLIKNGNIQTMAGMTLSPGDLLIEDGKIKRIEKNIEVEDSDDMTVWDVKGCNVLPGFIECHCHAGITEERKGSSGEDANESTDPITPYLRALDAIAPMDAAFTKAVQAGITTVMVGPGSSNPIGGQFLLMKTAGSRVIDDLVVKQPSAMKLAFGENPKCMFGDKDKMPSTRMGIAALIREELTKGQQYWKEKKAAAKKKEPWKQEFRKECWIPVFEKEIPLKCHVHRTDDIMTAIRIAKEFDVNLTLDHCSEGHLIAEEIKAAGFPAIVGPDLASRSKIEVENMDFKTAGVLSKAGVLLSITTDHPVTLIQSLPLCAGLAVKHGLDMEEGLKAITINAAKICGISHLVGSLEVGKDADITIYQGSPLEVFSQCMGTIIKGKVYYNYLDEKQKRIE